MSLQPLFDIENFLTDGVETTDSSNFVERMDQMYRWADDLIGQTVAATTKLYGQPPLCGKGCHFCCHQTLILSYAEVLYIYHKLKSESRLAPLLEKARQRQEELQFYLGGDTLPTLNLSDHQREIAQRLKEQNRLHLPCIFLDPEGMCSIYSFRPLTCRDAHVFEGDPVECRDMKNPVVNTIPFRPFYKLLAAGLSAKMVGRTGGGELSAILLEIDLMRSGDF